MIMVNAETRMASRCLPLPFLCKASSHSLSSPNLSALISIPNVVISPCHFWVSEGVECQCVSTAKLCNDLWEANLFANSLKCRKLLLSVFDFAKQ